ncbi:MAG: DHH family phosphoesterase, partial [Saccharofermentans sp.]|nr:DHH family phosphoesterase [Saccharofermentans sp.]
MKLSDLLDYKDIVIQCHDNPDADAIASGFALHEYFKQKGKAVRFIYSGNFKIKKSNLVYMVTKLNIPIEYEESLRTVPDLLITCDCQYGEGNVRQFPAKNICVIDHHQLAIRIPDISDIRPNMGSCSTVIWDLMRAEGMEIKGELATAMYYGLLTDTNNFAELSHPLDRDMKDYLRVDTDLINKMCNMNITLDEVKIAG